MKKGDIYSVTLDPSQGREQKGTRPVLIISASDFNQKLKIPVILPITQGGDFSRTAGFAVNLQGSGTQTQGVIRCDQPRAIDIAARHGYKIESVPDFIIDQVLAKFAVIFDL